jgi:hypothetical protein
MWRAVCTFKIANFFVFPGTFLALLREFRAVFVAQTQAGERNLFQVNTLS